MSEEMQNQREGGFLLSKIHQLSQRIFAKIIKEHNLEEFNPALGRIMFALWKEDKLPIHKLVERTQFSKSTLTFHLDKLEEAGYIKRLLNKEDRREILICLTEQNHALQDKYVDVSKEMTKLFYNNFSDEEIDEFENFLKRILKNLSDYND